MCISQMAAVVMQELTTEKEKQFGPVLVYLMSKYMFFFYSSIDHETVQWSNWKTYQERHTKINISSLSDGVY